MHGSVYGDMRGGSSLPMKAMASERPLLEPGEKWVEPGGPRIQRAQRLDAGGGDVGLRVELGGRVAAPYRSVRSLSIGSDRATGGCPRPRGPRAGADVRGADGRRIGLRS